MNTLILSLLLGLAAAGLVAAVRAVVQDIRPQWLLVRPLACDLCCSWWSSVALVGYCLFAGLLEPTVAPLALLASTGVSLATVRGSNRLAE